MAKSERKAPWDVGVERPDVAVLVALKEEFRSLAKEYERDWSPQPNPRYVGNDFVFEGPGGYRCVATIMQEMGTTHAASAAMRLLEWRPAVIINVGIAGGFKKGDSCIGDVIVPREVYAYIETGKQKDAPKKDTRRRQPKTDASEPRWERRGSSYHPTPTIFAEVQQLENTNREAHSAWVEAGAKQLGRLRRGARAQVKTLLDAELLRTKPIISTSHLASGNFVVASKAFAEFIREANANVHAGEMEAGGMMLAAEYQRDDIKTLVVRGISDHVDADKSQVDAVGGGALRRLAMDNAWRLVCTLMALGLLPRAESPKGRGRKAAAKKKATSSTPRRTKAAKVGTTATKAESGSSISDVGSPTPPLDDHALVDALAGLFTEKQARVVLDRVAFPKAQQPRHDDGQTFWHEAVALLRKGIIKGDGVQQLIDVAAKMRPGNDFLARYTMALATSPKPKEHRVGAEQPPEPVSSRPDPVVVGEVIKLFRRRPEIVEQLRKGEEAWQRAADEGERPLASMLSRSIDPVALVEWARTQIERMPRSPAAKDLADAMFDLLDLVLPVVAEPFLRLSADGTPTAAYPLTVEAVRARSDGRPIEVPDRNAPDPRPRALVDTKRRPKTSAHASGGVLDVARRIQEQHEDLALADSNEARLLDAVMDVFRAAGIEKSTTVQDMPPDEKVAYAEVVLPMIHGRQGHPMKLYVIAPRRRPGEPVDRFFELLIHTLKGLHVVETPQRNNPRDIKLLAALEQLYAAYRNLLEDLSR